MSELSDREYEGFARKLVTECMKIGKGADGKYDAVYIVYNPADPTCEKFAMMVEEECWRVGASTLLRPRTSARQRLMHELMPDDTLSAMPPIAEAIMKSCTARMFIGLEDDPLWASGIADRVAKRAPVRLKLRQILDRRKVRWVYFGWPVPAAAKFYGLPVEEFRSIFFDSIRQSFAERVKELTEYYRRALDGADRVRVVADGTDLTFRIKGRPVLVDDGVISDEDIARGDVGLNIPTGEVFVAPLETTAEGYITFEDVAIPGFGRVKGLKLVFEEGRVVNFEADENAEAFAKFLEANTGDKDRIAELGVGCNPGARYTGAIIVDEKIYRTIHIAIGSNTGTYHGRNKASAHLDMIKDMRGGALEVDGRVVMERGEPVT